MANILRIFLLYLLSLCFTACAFYSGSIKGQVAEQADPNATKISDLFKHVPIADAYVLTRSYGYYFRLVIEPGEVCIKNRLVKTDSSGNFNIPVAITFPKFYPVYGKKYVTKIYKNGYSVFWMTGDEHDFLDENPVVLQKIISSDHNKRLVTLGALTYVGCNEYYDDYDPDLKEWYTAIYNEAMTLPAPTTPSARSALGHIITMFERGQK